MRDEENHLLANLVMRIQNCRLMQRAGLQPNANAEVNRLLLTELEMIAVEHAALIVLSQEAGKDSVPALRQQVADLRMVLQIISASKPTRGHLRALVATNQQLAQDALDKDGGDWMAEETPTTE